MFLGYQNGKIKFYTKEPLNPSFYQLERTEYTDKEYVLDGEEYVLKDEAWGEKQAQKEAERIAMLNLTGADVERGIYKARGMDFDDIITYLEAQPLAEDGQPVVDIKALKIELKANNFYRGNPYIDVVGTLLGFTKEQLDEFFETNDYRYLTNCTITINPTPAEAVVTINGVKQMSITVPYGSEVYYIVTAEGYKEQSGTVIVVESETFGVVLEEVENENTADTAE